MNQERAARLGEFHSLRSGLDPDARKLLGRIWTEFQQSGRWPATRVIHLAAGSKQRAEATLRHISGSVVQEAYSDGESRYQLSLLGALAARLDNTLELLLSRYLEFAREVFRRDPKEGKIDAVSLGRTFELDHQSLVLVGRIVREYGLYSSLFDGHDTPNWTCGLPSDVDELLEEKDLQAHVKCRAMRGFDESIPVFAAERVQYLHTRHRGRLQASETSGFDFVKNAELRRIATESWKEVLLIESINVPRAAVILCGSILEAVLLDDLKRRTKSALQAFKDQYPKAASKPLDQWTLSQLLAVAVRMTRVTRVSTGLSQAVLEWRNLVHPGREARKSLRLSAEEARVAVSTVRIVIGEFRGAKRVRARELE